MLTSPLFLKVNAGRLVYTSAYVCTNTSIHFSIPVSLREQIILLVFQLPDIRGLSGVFRKNYKEKNKTTRIESKRNSDLFCGRLKSIERKEQMSNKKKKNKSKEQNNNDSQTNTHTHYVRHAI